MQSEQEKALRFFLDRSIGANYMFVPQKYRKGKAHREPCDLAFVSDQLAVLFYACSGNAELKHQIAHNLRQANGYLRLWATGETRYVLRGQHSSTGHAFVPYGNLHCIVAISVVSAKCGPQFHRAVDGHPKQLQISIPDELLYLIAQVGGGIADLLEICHQFQIINAQNEPIDHQFSILLDITNIYIKNALCEPFRPDSPDAYNPARVQDIDVIRKHFLHTKSLPVSGRNVSQSSHFRIFADMSLRDHVALAHCCEFALKRSGPKFEGYVIDGLHGGHYEFIIVTLHMGARNTDAVIDKVMNEAYALHPNAILCIHMYYGEGMTDVRAPSMWGLPAELPPMQSLQTAEKMIKSVLDSMKTPTRQLWRYLV